LVSGGDGCRDARIEMPRLSARSSLSVYLLALGEVSLEWEETFFVSSNETVGKDAAGMEEIVTLLDRWMEAASLLGGCIMGVILVPLLVVWLGLEAVDIVRTPEARREFRGLMQDLRRLFERIKRIVQRT
jgi:hypothetical protein